MGPSLGQHLLVQPSCSASGTREFYDTAARQVLIDDTGAYANGLAHLKDQLRAPIADMKRLIRENAVGRAHARVRMSAPEFSSTRWDVRYLLGIVLLQSGCQLVSRLFQYVVKTYTMSRTVLLEDDFHQRRRHFRPTFVAEDQRRNDDQLDWFRPPLEGTHNGIIREDIKRSSSSGIARRHEQALGRVVFVTSAVELIRPFLSPHCAVASCRQRNVSRTIRSLSLSCTVQLRSAQGPSREWWKIKDLSVPGRTVAQRSRDHPGSIWNLREDCP